MKRQLKMEDRITILVENSNPTNQININNRVVFRCEVLRKFIKPGDTGIVTDIFGTECEDYAKVLLDRSKDEVVEVPLDYLEKA